MAHSSGGRLAGRPVGGWTSHRKNAPFLYFHTTRDTTPIGAFIVLWLLAFQNGFFWQTVLKREGKGNRRVTSVSE